MARLRHFIGRSKGAGTSTTSDVEDPVTHLYAGSTNDHRPPVCEKRWNELRVVDFGRIAVQLLVCVHVFLLRFDLWKCPGTEAILAAWFRSMTAHLDHLPHRPKLTR